MEWLIVSICVVAVVLLVAWWMVPRPKSLYERLGGVYNIAAVIDSFSDEVVRSPIIGANSPNPALADWHTNQLGRLPGLKFMRTLWVCALAGGPFKYSPTVPGKCPFSLEKAHAKFKMSSEEFDEAARILSETLDQFNVPAAEKSEVLGAFGAHKVDIVTPGKVKCPFRW